MLSTVYHKKAFVLKIPLLPLAKGSLAKGPLAKGPLAKGPPSASASAFPKGDNKDDDYIFMKILPTHFHDELN